MVGSPILKAFFGPRKARAFQKTSWPNLHLIHHGSPDRLPAVFRDGDLSSFERLAAAVEIDAGGIGQKPEVRGGVAFLGARGQQNIYSVHEATATRLLQAGLNIFFQNFRLASLEPWLGQLAAQVGIARTAIRLYAFAAPPGANQGTDAHWDPNEVIHIQLQGRKVMRLAANAHVLNPDVGIFSRPFPEDLVGQFHQQQPPLGPPRVWNEVELRPGSVVYFPRGCWHETSTTGPSFAVGIGFLWPTAADLVLDHLRTRLRQSAAWRAPLFGIHSSPTAIRTHERNLSVLMRGLGLSSEFHSSSDAVSRTLPTDQRVALRGLDGRYVRLLLTITTRRQGNGSRLIRIRTREEGAFELEVSPRIASVTSWITSRRRPFTLREFAKKFPNEERTTLEDLLVLLIENGAIQFDPRPNNHRPA